MGTAADPRTAISGVHLGRLRALLLSVGGAGLLLLAVAGARLDLLHAELPPAFWLVCALLVLAEVRPLFTAGGGDANGLPLSTAFVFAILLRHGLPAALLLQAVGTLVADSAKRKALWRTWFNIGQYTLAWTAAAAVMELAGHHAGLGDPLDLSGRDLLAAACGAAVYFVVNELLVGWAIACSAGERLRTVLREDAGYELLTTSALLALAPLICLAMERGAAFVPLLLPPLLAVYAVASVALDREQRALSDPLTGLANRSRFAQCAEVALREGEVAVVLFDLDRFKEVNDTLGHHVGDRLLRVVADRLRDAMRPSDTVARLGGDEFALVLPGATAADALATAERLRALLCEPIVLEGLLLDIGASAGVAVSPGHGTTVEELLRHADVAMYVAKESGAVELYEPERDEDGPGCLTLLDELRQALEADELELLYAPQVQLAAGAVDTVEALVRWRHHARGLVPADEFVPLAERTGLAQVLTARVLDAALRQLGAWRAMGLDLRVTVDVGAKDLCGGALADEVARALARHGLAAGCLQLELTEGALTSDPERAAGTLLRLQELGVALSLEGFGTGSAGLAGLRRLPVRELKVDRSFVRRMDDPFDHAVVRGVVGLAHSVGMTVVAEGVEDALTFHRLAALGCDAAQGSFVARAQPADELTPWLLERAATATAALPA